jgi:hypothetical protein
MQRLAILAALAVVASPLAAQENPFKLPKNKVSGIEVSYAYSGDVQGTGQKMTSKDRMVSRETTSTKMFGKTSTVDRWTMLTEDSSYTVNLKDSTGTREPNMLPVMAKAYDDLDGASKQRLHQNMQDMAQMISRAFGSQALWSGQKTGTTKTYAGETCEEHTFGPATVCSMTDAPGVPLHMQAQFACFDIEQTATSVTKGGPPATAFVPPSGIKYQPDTLMQNPDSMAHLFVGYLASQQLADSIAKAKAEMAKQQSSANAGGEGSQREMTPEEKEQMRQSCEALKNFNLGKTMADAGKSVVKEAVNEAVQEKKAEEKNKAKEKIKGLIKHPHF